MRDFKNCWLHRHLPLLRRLLLLPHSNLSFLNQDPSSLPNPHPEPGFFPFASPHPPPPPIRPSPLLPQPWVMSQLIPVWTLSRGASCLTMSLFSSFDPLPLYLYPDLCPFSLIDAHMHTRCRSWIMRIGGGLCWNLLWTLFIRAVLIWDYPVLMLI